MERFTKRRRRKTIEPISKRVCVKQSIVYQLPAELWTHIARFLDDKSLIALRRTCHFLSQAIERSLVQYLTVYRPLFWMSLLRRHPPLETWKWVLTRLSWSRDELLDKFCDLLAHNLFPICQWFHETCTWSPEECRKFEGKIVRSGAASGNLDMVKWLHSIFAITKQDIIACNVFYNAAAGGSIEVCRWLYTTFQLVPADVPRNSCAEALWNAAEKDHLTVCKWVQSTFQLTREEVMEYDELTDSYNELICEGRFEVCFWLYYTYQFTANITMLRLACMDGHLPLCTWIYSLLPTEDVEEERMDLYFDCVLEYGQVDVCKWLHGILPLTKQEVVHHRMLRRAVHSGSVELCDWFYTTFEFTETDLYCNDFELLDYASDMSKTKVCKWLYRMAPEKAALRRDILIEKCVQSWGGYKACQWLHSVFQYSPNEIKRMCLLEKALVKGIDGNARWLCKTFHMQPENTDFYKAGTYYHTLLQQDPELAQKVEKCIKNCMQPEITITLALMCGLL